MLPAAAPQRGRARGGQRAGADAHDPAAAVRAGLAFLVEEADILARPAGVPGAVAQPHGPRPAARPARPVPGRTRRCVPDGQVRRAATFRHAGKVRHETLANLSRLPEQVIALVDAALKGTTLVDAEAAFETERSVPHGNAAAAHVMASKLGLAGLLGPPCRERDIACALILSRAVRPESKLSTVGWWQSGDTTLGADLSVAGACTDEVYAAMDWLAGRQREIEKQLAARHLREGGIAMFGLSSSRA